MVTTTITTTTFMLGSGCGQLPGHVDMFYSNMVVLTRDGDYGHGTCSGPGMTVVHDNIIFTPAGNVTECGMSLADWQAKGNDQDTMAGKGIPDETLVDAMKDLLGCCTGQSY